MAYKNITLDQLMQGFHKVESSGNYNAMGPWITRKDGTKDRAYGIDQVMGDNVGPWTQQYFGQRLTPEQFLNSKDAQVAVSRGKMGELYNKFGNPQDVVSTWFSGRPLRQAGNASDGFMNTPDYVNKVLNAAQAYDPNSMVATAPDGAGSIPNAPVAPQSITLGDQENQQPLNNIGSTLANMGASIASLDRGGTGIASLNASRVASNLAQQEQQRAAEGGWKYAGQTQNGQGLMFQNSKGEIRVEPLAPGFSGQKEPETIRTLRMLQDNPSLMDTLKEKSSTTKEPLDPHTAEYWSNMVLENPNLITQVPKEHRPQIMDGFVKSAEAAGYTAQDAVQRGNDIKGNIVEDRKRSQIIAQVGSARPEFEAAATNFIKSAEKVHNKFGNIPLDTLYNKTITTLDPNSEDAIAINNMKVAQEGLTKGFVRAMSGSAAGNAHAEERMTKLFDPAQPLNMVKGGIGVLVRDVKNYDESARFARDNARARNAGKPIPHPELEDENAVLERILGTNQTSSSGGTKQTGSGSLKVPTSINPSNFDAWAKENHVKKGQQIELPDGSVRSAIKDY